MSAEIILRFVRSDVHGLLRSIADISHLPVQPLLPHWPENQSLSFDQEARIFLEQLESNGFKIEAWTKAPYLCEGDLRQSFYWLVDIVVVLSKK